MIKSSGNGPFLIPTAPAIGTTVTQSGSANTFGSYTQMTASTGEADFIVGICVANPAFTNTSTIPGYIAVAIGTGGAGSETQVGLANIVPVGTAAGSGGAFNVGGFMLFDQPIPVGNAVRIACKTASDVAVAFQWKITLIMMKQSECVDAGVSEAATLSDGVAHGGTLGSSTATLAFSRVNFTSQTTDTNAFTCQGNGTGDGIEAIGGATGHGLHILGGSSSGAAATFFAQAGNSNGIETSGKGTSNGFFALGGDGTGGDGIHVSGGAGASVGIRALGGGTSGEGFLAAASAGNSNGATLTKAGSGQDLLATLVAANFGAASLNGKGDWTTAASLPANFSALGITAGGHISTIDAYTGDTPQTGDSFGRIGVNGSGLTSIAPAASALSTAQWTNARAANLDNLDATVNSRLATAGYTAPDNTGIGQINARLPGSPAAVGSPMTLDLTQAIPIANADNTMGDCLNAARTQGLGKWVIDPIAKTLKLYAPDNTTVIKTFTLAPTAEAATSRT